MAAKNTITLARQEKESATWCGTLLIVRSCLHAGLRPGGIPMGLASFSPLRERNLDNGRVAETENHDTNDKEPRG
jgi:hypothetical protein